MKNHHKLLCTAAAVAITVALSGPIMAADAPVRKGPAPVAAPLFDWNGLYLGGHVGYGRTSFSGQASNGSVTLSPKPKGFLVGLHVGQNFQTAPNWLWGWEGDLSVTGGWSETIQTTAGASSLVSGQTNGIASLRGRLGWVFDRSLFYVTGGIAAVNWNGWATSTPQERGKSRITWAPVAGGGIEWKVRPNLSFRAEGLYYWNRGTQTDTGGFVKIKNTAVFRVGASWYY